MKKILRRFYLITIIQSIGLNLAHPVTPSLIKNLALPDYIFFLAFASMAFTNFLFSPFWGKLSDLFGQVRIFVIALLGYAVGQALFGLAHTQFDIVFARLLAGLFIGGMAVGQLTFLSKHTPSNQRAKYFTILTTLVTVSSAVGYLIGGLIGDLSIAAVFVTQVVLIILSALSYPLLIKEDRKVAQSLEIKALIKQANPLKAFIDIKDIMNWTLILIGLAVLFSSLGLTAYDQNFNYFIRDVFNFPPSSNGIVKAVLGLVSLISNFSLGMYLLKKEKTSKTLIIMNLIISVLLMIIAFNHDLFWFILFNIFLSAFTSINVPLQQALLISSIDGSHQGLAAGLYNSIKSLGMIGGALFAGFVFQFGANQAFIYASLFFFVALLMILIYRRKDGKH